MFAMKEVGKRITEGRRAKGMTQMALADALGISYQAVSSWENGRTMPDISKLPEISEILGISVDEILGKEAPAVQAALTNDTEAVLTPEDIAEAAPILPDERVEEMVEKQMESDAVELDYDAVEPLLNYLDEDTCGKIFHRLYENGEYAKMVKMLDYVEEDAVDEVFLGMVADGKEEARKLLDHVSDDAANKAFQSCVRNEWWEMAKRMADYVDEDVIGAEMLALAQAGKLDQLPLFDYPDEDDIAKIAWDAYQKGGVPAVKPMLDYISEDGIERIAWDAYQKDGVPAVKPMLDYISEDGIEKIAWDAYQKDGVPAVKPMLDYISEDGIEKIAMDAAKRHGIPAITPLLDYLDEDFLKETIRKAYNL